MAKSAETSGASFDALLGAIAERGVELSPRERLKALQVFGLRPEWPLGELADALAAVLATSPADLKRLRSTLRECLAVPQELRERSSETEKSPNRWTRWLSWKGAPAAASFLAILAFAGFALLPRPRAVDDCTTAQDCTLYSNETRTFHVLDNDVAPFGARNIRLVELPQLGTATLNADRSVTYTPSGKVGKDRLVYELQHWSGTARGLLKLTVLTPPPPAPSLPSTGKRTRIYNMPGLGKPVFHPNVWPPLRSFLWPSAISVGALALYGLYLGWARRRRRTDPPDWDPIAPERFRPGEIGGLPPAWLLPRDLDQLAEVPIFLETDEESGRLDPRATVEESARALRPELHFEHRREALSILLLVDDDTAALDWNPLPRELAQGLEARGLPVEAVRFSGTLTRLYGRGNAALALADFEENRDRLLVLVVSDGAGLYADDMPLLEILAGFPRIAWLDPREPRFWDERTELVEELGLSVFPASREGVATAFDRLLSHRGGEGSAFSVAELGRRGLRVRWQDGLRAEVEEVLGDALAWATSAAMIQPVTVALAQKLRERFYPALPEMAIGRLFALPGTRVTVTGLRFADPVVAILREGFSQILDRAKTVQVLQFLLAELAALRPAQSEERPGLALLAWQAIYERLHLELEPDIAVKQLARLAETPVGHTVRADLAKLERPWREGVAGEGEILPLRLEPETREAKTTLDDLARRGARNSPKPEQLTRREWSGLILLGTALVLSLWPFVKAWQEEGRKRVIIEFHAVGNNDRQSSMLTQSQFAVLSNDDKILALAAGRTAAFNLNTLPLKSPVRLFAIGPGRWRERNWTREDDRGGVLEVPVLREPEEKPCITSDQPLRGIVTQLCPVLDGVDPLPGQLELPSWRTKLGPAAGPRSLSIGIEIGSTRTMAFDGLRDALLASSSVDRVYRIDLGKVDLTEALAAIQRDLRPWAGETQALWWSSEPFGIDSFGDLLGRQAREDRFASHGRLELIGGPYEAKADPGSTGTLKLADDFRSETMRIGRMLWAYYPSNVTDGISLSSLQVTMLSFYPAGGDTLSPWSQALLAKAANQLAQEPKRSIVVIGYAWNQKSEARNVRWSQRLADLVARQLTEKLGIDPRRITSQGRGTLGTLSAVDDVVYLVTGFGTPKPPTPKPPTVERTGNFATRDSVRAPGNFGAVDPVDVAKSPYTKEEAEKILAESDDIFLVNLALKRLGFLADIYFDFDESGLSDDARFKLMRDADLLHRYPLLTLTIEGHTGSHGTHEYSLMIGEREAGAVRSYLESLGIDSARMRVISYGKERPVCESSEEACQSQNRRAHIAITGKKATQ